METDLSSNIIKIKRIYSVDDDLYRNKTKYSADFEPRLNYICKSISVAMENQMKLNKDNSNLHFCNNK